MLRGLANFARRPKCGGRCSLALDFDRHVCHGQPPASVIAVVRDGVVSEVRNWPSLPSVAALRLQHGVVRTVRKRWPMRPPGRWTMALKAHPGRATVVAHNAGFDMTVLRGTLASHRPAHPAFRYRSEHGGRIWPARSRARPCAASRHSAGGTTAPHDAEATAELVSEQQGRPARPRSMSFWSRPREVRSFFRAVNAPQRRFIEVRMA